MLETIAVICLLIWLVAIANGFGGLWVHLFLLAAVVLVFGRVVSEPL